MTDITLWLPETRTVIHQALGKAAEEACELSKIAVRCMIQGLDAVDPGTGKPNRQSLADELADVEATTEWLFELLSLDVEAHNARATRKLEGFRRWQAMIEAHEADASPQADDHLMAENEKLRKMLSGCDWFWPEDDTSSDACADGPWQIAENHDVKPGEVFGYSRGGVVETRYYGFLEAAEDSDSDDQFEVDEPTREAAEAKIAAELERRAALATTEGKDNG